MRQCRRPSHTIPLQLIRGGTHRCIYRNQSKIISAPAKRQSSNGLVERTWQTLCTMAYAYLPKAQIPHNLWFHTVHHARRTANQIPAKVNGKLITPFDPVAPDSRTWFPLFGIVFFWKDSNKQQGQ